MLDINIYDKVSISDPFIVLTVRNVDLPSLPDIGDTYISVYRVGKEAYRLTYLPIEAKNNTFTFGLDGVFFANPSGRYGYEFYYKGTFLGSKQFEYFKPEIEFIGN